MTASHDQTPTAQRRGARNRAVPLDVERLAETTVSERLVGEQIEAASAAVARLHGDAERGEVLATVAGLDLTSLTGAETGDDVSALCVRAERPLPGRDARCAAVCVFPRFVAAAVARVGRSGLPVAAAAFGPHPGRGAPDLRIDDMHRALDAGAREIDVVVTIDHIHRERWQALHEETARFREAAGDALLKVILEAGAADDLTRLRRASHVAVAAGADFLKTSTGKATPASLMHGAVMLEAIRACRQWTDVEIGFKPAGGIHTVRQALEWRALVRTVLGEEALDPTRFRIGASGLLDALVRRLDEPHAAGTTRGAET